MSSGRGAWKMRRQNAWLWIAVGTLACGGAPTTRRANDWRRYVYERGGLRGEEVGSLMLRREVCDGQDLLPEKQHLDEGDFVRFLERHGGVASVERPRPDLAYVTLPSSAGRAGVRLRVALLANADDAGRELATAIAQHGSGAWGVHRANLAVLGPVLDPAQILVLAGSTKLACWGVFTLASDADVYVVPGGYREL
jgi:hypothetical protein